MNLFSIFVISFTIALSGALAPGPVLTTVIYESLRKGAKSGPLIILGHALLEICMVAALIIGLTNFVNNPRILKIVSFIGVIILIFFGVKMIVSFPPLSLEKQSPTSSSSNLPLLGITMSIANPYWTIWWLTIGLGLLLGAQKEGLIGILIFFTGHILADLGWYTAVSFIVSRGRKFISAVMYKRIVVACGLTLIGFGIWFAAHTVNIQ